jgi:uncharacterized membrane protein YdjX (TVP38/TMEM64 family)
MAAAASGWRRVVLVIVLVGALALAARWWIGGAWSLTPNRNEVQAAGPAAPWFFMALYALATVLMLPGAPLTLSAGFLFGPLFGVLYAWLGAGVGAIAAYGIGRRGRGPLHAWLHQRFSRATRYVDDHSLGTVLTLRLVPLVPFNGLNYGLGLTGVPPRPYVLGTLLGILPGTTAYVMFGAAASSGTQWTSPSFYTPLALAILLTVAGILVARRLQASTPRAE